MNKKIFTIVLVVPLLLGFSAILVLERLFAYNQASYREAEVFAEVKEIIREYYVEEVAPEKIFKGALQGMVSVLDQHSEYLDEENYRQLFEGTEGEFIGIGIEISLENGLLTVISPLEGSPAAKSGVLAGDKIIGIDGQSAEGISLTDAVKKLRGKKGSKVTITVLHEASKAPVEIEIVRDVIQIQSIKDAAILDRESGIGYLRVSKFNRHTGTELQSHIAQLVTQGMKSLIIDLRFNPGGLLDAAVEVVDLFVGDGIIVYTKGRNAESYRVYRATEPDIYENLPLAILVNKRSASASEIVAGALQDYHRAIIVGAHTYGKGSVQTILRLKDEKTALKLTTAKYYTPSGRSIERWTDSQEDQGSHGGIRPDLLVDVTLEEERELLKWIFDAARAKNSVNDKDKQLLKAIAALKESGKK